MYTFSLSAFIFGLLVLAAGAAFLKWHQKIADNMGSGLADYSRYKLWALIVCGFGLLLMVNLPGFLLDIMVGKLFRQE